MAAKTAHLLKQGIRPKSSRSLLRIGAVSSRSLLRDARRRPDSVFGTALRRSALHLCDPTRRLRLRLFGGSSPTSPLQSSVRHFISVFVRLFDWPSARLQERICAQLCPQWAKILYKNMATPVTLLCSNRYPSGSGFRVSSGFSAVHFNKQVVGRVQFRLSRRNNKVAISTRSTQESLLQRSVSQSAKLRGFRGYLQPINCALSENATSESEKPVIASIRGSFESVKTSFSQLTPIDVCKWCGIIAVAIAASKWFVNLILSPFFWVYFSCAWMFWPWSVAIAVGAYGIHCFRKFYNGEATVLEQFALVTSTFTWLTLVPPAFFNGYIDGWPVAFFFIYHYFVFFNATVRKRMYGDTCLRPHDAKWDVSVPALYRLLFCVGVTIGHWLAAFEGPELIRLAGGWYNGFVWGLILITLFMQYHATFYLAKYSDKVVVPSVVVQFGPFRWVRHPIYASTMLLFVSYFAALQAPISALYMAAVCVLYYNQKAVLEEAVLLEEFGENYVEYTKKVPYKFIPFVY